MPTLDADGIQSPGERRQHRPGYNRPKDPVSRGSQLFWWTVLVIATVVAMGTGAYPVLLVDIVCLGIIAWLEWSATSEDRAKVTKVNIVLGTAIVALGAHAAHEEKKIRDRQHEQAATRRQQGAVRKATAPYDAQGKWVGYNPLDYGDR